MIKFESTGRFIAILLPALLIAYGIGLFLCYLQVPFDVQAWVGVLSIFVITVVAAIIVRNIAYFSGQEEKKKAEKIQLSEYDRYKRFGF